MLFFGVCFFLYFFLYFIQLTQLTDSVIHSALSKSVITLISIIKFILKNSGCDEKYYILKFYHSLTFCVY